MNENINNLIKDLKKVDSDKFFKKEFYEGFFERRKYANPIVESLIKQGAEAVEPLIEVLNNYNSWSCIFAAKVLGGIGDKKAVIPLIKTFEINYADFLHEEASIALQKFGNSIFEDLKEEIERILESKSNSRALTSLLNIVSLIKTEVATDYLISLKDRIDSEDVDFYCLCLGNTGSKKAIPVLLEFFKKYRHYWSIEAEIKSSLELIEKGESKPLYDEEEMRNPKIEGIEPDSLKEIIRKGIFNDKNKLKNIHLEYSKNILNKGFDMEDLGELRKANSYYHTAFMLNMSDYHASLAIARVERKLGYPNLKIINNSLISARNLNADDEIMELIEEEKADTINALKEKGEYDEADEYKWFEFICKDCNKVQIIRTGKIYAFDKKTDDFFNLIYESEIMCKNCSSHNLELTNKGKNDIMLEQIGANSIGESVVIFAENKVLFEGTKVPFKKLEKFVNQKLETSSNDPELLLRVANMHKKLNNHNKAIELYKQSIKLKPKLIANYHNLLEIFALRHKDFNLPGAREEAEFNLEEMKRLLNLGNFDSSTIPTPEFIPVFIKKMEEVLYG